MSLLPHTPVIIKEKFTPVECAIINAIIYFDIFRYPLTKIEVQKFCRIPVPDIDEFDDAITSLVNEQFVKHHNGFYFVNEDPSVIQRRMKGNILAKEFLEHAKKYSKLISKFPFVKAVFISGSLSKGFMDRDSDIDYFIITEPGRLWLCRTFLILYKKIFLLNSHKYFCVNYFVDNFNLEIPDKNIFTATELMTLMPMFNTEMFKEFLEANTWTKKFLPNISDYPIQLQEKTKQPKVKSLLEKIFNSRLGNKLETLCFHLTLKYWKRKFSYFSENDFKNALRSRKGVSKHHPNKFQEKVLSVYNEKIIQFEQKHEVILNSEPEFNTCQFP